MQSPKVGVSTAGLLQGKEEPGGWQLLFRLDLPCVRLYVHSQPSHAREAISLTRDSQYTREYSHHEASRWFIQTAMNVLI